MPTAGARFGDTDRAGARCLSARRWHGPGAPRAAPTQGRAALPAAPLLTARPPKMAPPGGRAAPSPGQPEVMVAARLGLGCPALGARPYCALRALRGAGRGGIIQGPINERDEKNPLVFSTAPGMLWQVHAPHMVPTLLNLSLHGLLPLCQPLIATATTSQVLIVFGALR